MLGRERQRVAAVVVTAVVLDVDVVVVVGFVEFEDLGPTDDALERQGSLRDGDLDRADEALAAGDGVTARKRLHRRLGVEADYTLQR